MVIPLCVFKDNKCMGFSFIYNNFDPYLDSYLYEEKRKKLILQKLNFLSSSDVLTGLFFKKFIFKGCTRNVSQKRVIICLNCMWLLYNRKIV